MADLDDQPAKLSELDLSEDAAITGDDVEDTLEAHKGSSAVKADPDAEPSAEDEDEAAPG